MKEFFGWFFWGSITAFSFGITLLGLMGIVWGSIEESVLGLIVFVLGSGLLSACLVKVMKRVKAKPKKVIPVPNKITSTPKKKKMKQKIIGNQRTKVYHMPDSPLYNSVSHNNRVVFRSEEEAIAAGYRRSEFQQKPGTSTIEKRQDFDSLMEKADEAIASHRFDEAITAFKGALLLEPNSIQAHYGLGSVYADSGQYKRAVLTLKKAINLTTSSPEEAILFKSFLPDMHFSLGLAFADLGQFEEAVTAYEEAIRIKPDWAEPHGWLGAAYEGLGIYEKAIEAFREAIRLKPEWASPHFFLGQLYAELARFDEALPSLREAIRLKPEWAEAHFSLGIVWLAVGAPKYAMQEYNVLKELDSNMANELLEEINKY